MFKPLPNEDLKYLNIARQKLQKRLPKCAQLYNVVQLMISESYPPEIKTKLYAFSGKDCVNDDDLYIEDTMFIVAVQYRDVYSDYAVVLSSPDSLTPEMTSAFESLVDWTTPICFCAVDVAVSSNIAELCTKHGNLDAVDPCDFMTMTIECAKAIELVNTDPDVSVRALDPSDGALVTKRWTFAQDGTETLMGMMIKHIGSAGVYVKNKLASWIVIFAVGSLNALHTEDEFRQRGYARLTMQKVCKTAGEKFLVPNVQVQKGNIPSTRLMESVGFKYSHDVEWVIYSNK